MECVLALDQGTTSSRSILFDRVFEPRIGRDEAEARFARWRQAVDRCKGWEGHP